MKPLIHPQAYCDAAGFRAERDRIFLHNWIFACSTRELANHDDYCCIDIGGIPVVVQNFEGSIRAFNNVCSHRFARIQSAKCGNRALKCPYHGWIYNREGLPTGIPHKPLISDITSENLCEYRLSRWHVRIVGPLVFIKKESHGQHLRDDDFDRQIGDYGAALKQLSSAFGEIVENTDYEVKANWKVVVENTLEGYHVDCVHPNTIKKLGMGGLSTSPQGESAEPADDPASGKGSRFTFSGHNSAVFSSLNHELSARMDRTYTFLANRPQKFDGYRHYYLFPNFVFASTRGESFSLQRILPIDEKTTQLTSYLFATSGFDGLSKMEMALKKQFYNSAAEFVRAIFAEDAAICEQVQSAVAFAHTNGVLSDEERRICSFHSAYAAVMDHSPSVKNN